MKTLKILLFFSSISICVAEGFDPSKPLRILPLGQPECLNVYNDELKESGDSITDNPQIDENLPTLLGRLKKILNKGRQLKLHRSSIDLSKLIYDLPDLETANSPEEFIKQYDNFYAQTPAGYRVYFVSSDPRYGLKYVVWSPLQDGPESPWLLSIAGTQTLKDWVADTDLGRKQLDRLSQLFSRCLFRDANDKFIFDRKLLIMGHSLGGGLAQALGYEVQRRLLMQMPEGTLSPIEVVTWNAFGAQHLVERVQKYQPEIIEGVRFTNYFVEGDLVSKVGLHIGKTFRVQAVPSFTKEKLGFVKAHKMITILEMVGTDPYQLEKAEELKPPFLNKITYLSKLGVLFTGLPAVKYSIKRHDITDMIAGSAELAANRKFTDSSSRQLMAYIKQLSLSHRDFFMRDGHKLFADDLMTRISRAEKSFYKQ
ncbi:MAG: hypothetical protein KA116_08400 [Proteobacteria bacterium]|nr:hypothetical protein [Pseudomonadota bacterium]